MRNRFVLLIILASFLPAYLSSQEAPTRSPDSQTVGVAADSDPISDRIVRRLSELIEAPVVGSDGQLRAKIVDVVFTTGGDITHLIVGFDESLRDYPSLDEELLLIPADRFDFGTVYQVIAVDISEGNLRDFQALSDGKLPVTLSGVSPRSQLLLGSQVIDYEVYGIGRRKLGEVEDVVLDLENNTVAYLAISSGGAFLGIGEKFRAVPLSGFDRLETAQAALYLEADKERWETIPGFDRDYWPAEPTGWEMLLLEDDARQTEPSDQSEPSDEAVPGETAEPADR